MRLNTQTDPSVLVVEDEHSLGSVYRHWLSRECDVTVVDRGTDALDAVTDDTDVVFLDRRLPDLDGVTVLERIRERDIDVRVVMVTGVKPDVDVLDMGFDDYLCKPVSEAELRHCVRRMLARATFDEATREYYALCSRKAALESVASQNELADVHEYDQIEARIDELRAEIEDAVDSFESADFGAAFHTIAGTND